MRKYYLYYPEIDYTYEVEVWKDEYIEYLWYKHFNKYFNPMDYLLDDKSSKVYNAIENKWLKNEIDEFSIGNEPEFLKFLLDRFEDEAKSSWFDDENENENENPNDWWDNLEYEEKETVMRDYKGY